MWAKMGRWQTLWTRSPSGCTRHIDRFNRQRIKTAMNVEEPQISSPLLLANWLGYAGLIPFVALTTLFFFPDHTSHAFISHALSSYAVAIISFLGAIHWGLEMRESPTATTNPASWIWGITPSLLAWVATLFTPPFNLLCMAILLWLCYRVDQKRYPHYQLEAWLPMRFRLTLVASVACVVSSIGFYNS